MSNKNNLRGKLNGLEILRGYSAYEVAVINGFKGTEAEWFETLRAESTEEAIEAAYRAKVEGENAVREIKAQKTGAVTAVNTAANEAISHIEQLAEGAYDIVQARGSSENQVMSQAAVTENLDAILGAFDTTGGHNLLDPSNATAGWWGYTVGGEYVAKDTNADKMERTINFIQIPSGATRIYISTNIEVTDDNSSKKVTIYFADADGLCLANETIATLSTMTKGVKIPNGATQMHIMQNGVDKGFTLDNFCVSVIEAEYEKYGEPKTPTAIKSSYLNTALSVDFVHGGLSSTDAGAEVSRTNRIRTDFITIQDLFIKRDAFETESDNINYIFYFYDENKAYLNMSGSLAEDVFLLDYIPEGASYVRIVIKKADDEDITSIATEAAKLHLYENTSKAYADAFNEYVRSELNKVDEDTGETDEDTDTDEDLKRLYAEVTPKFSLGGLSGSNGNGNNYSTNRIRTDFIPIKNLRIFADSDIKVNLFFYGKYGWVGDSHGFIGTSSWLYNSFYIEDYVPEGAKSVKIVLAYDDNRVVDDISALAAKATIFEIKESEYVSDIPENMGVLNTVLKAKQLCEIEFETKAVMPQQRGDLAANAVHKGFPYSSTRIDNLFVPNFVSLETFMTALKNPNSYLYTVDIGDLGNVNGDTYYGCVCSTYASYALGIPGMYTTHQWGDIPDMELLEYQHPSYFKIGDTICGNGHVLIVTDIMRNKRGRIGAITIMDAQPAKVVSTTYSSVDEVASKFPTSQYKYYRYKKIYASEHTQSPFVAVEDEIPQTFTYNTAIIPRKGDKANWRAGETVEIDVLEPGSYTSVEIYKDDTLLETKDMADLISLSGLTAGSYKARLTDGTNYSDYCYWIVVDAVSEATPVGNGGKVVVTFSATNATPSFIIWQGADGNGTKHIQFLTAEERAVGEAVGVYMAGSFKVRVGFDTEYGTIFSVLPEAITVV